MLREVPVTEVQLYCDVKFKHGSEHGKLQHGEKTCPYCDLCEHGKMRTQACDQAPCNDRSWQEPPITEAEYNNIVRTLSQFGTFPWRNSPLPRQYTCMSLLPKFLAAVDKNKLLGLS